MNTPHVTISIIHNLFCPHCGTKLLDLESFPLLHGKCELLVFVHCWGNQEDYGFLYVRLDYAKKHILKTKETTSYKDDIADGAHPITEEMEMYFERNEFSPGDEISNRFALYGYHSELYNPGTVFFSYEACYSGLIAAIDLGS